MYDKSENYSADSKYVADILSAMPTMSSSSAVSSTYTVPATAFVSGIPSGVTPTLTPTTLANLEQTFIELQAVPAVSTTGPIPHTQSGFVPPIVDPVHHSERSNDRYEYTDVGDPDWVPGAKRARTDRPNGTIPMQVTNSAPVRKRRNLKDEKLNPEEEERRRVRRERNKVAAAKCRQRRVDHTNRLTNETDQLEAEREDLESEIQTLQQQKDQLEFILQAHQPLCKQGAVENGVESSNQSGTTDIVKVKVKAEPTSESLTTTCAMGNKFKMTSIASSGMRPNSLNIKQERKSSVTSATGIPITTPSNGFFFNMDSMVDHTGLTPITNGPSSCSSEVNRTSSESSSETVNSPTLISL